MKAQPPTPTHPPCRLLIDPPSGGPWNMALDEALLEHAAASDDFAWLRFYQWREPTLSLGYFQPFAAWRAAVESDCAVVRRRTGGGAILHDHELTYSLVLSPHHPLAGHAEGLYKLVHEALIVALSRFGITAQLYGNVKLRAPHEEPFLCFQRRSASDVVINSAEDQVSGSRSRAREAPPALHASDYKICGSAQRRSRGALLQHGSLLLATSSVTPHLPGIQAITRKRIPAGDIRTAWTDELRPITGEAPPQLSAPPDAVLERARELEQSRFSSPEWTSRR